MPAAAPPPPPSPPPDDDDRELDRSTIRLDGLEVYAVVSALTTATSITCFDAFTPREWEELWSQGEYIALIGDTAFLVSSIAGIVAGMHATLVFSLMTMYGRTALGMDRDDAFGTFFTRTGMQRYRGFKTFLYSLYAFLVQVVILITAKTPSRVRVFAFLGVVGFMISVYNDTETIIDAAGIIFAPVPPKEVEEDELSGSAHRRVKLERRKSLRKGMTAAIQTSASRERENETPMEDKTPVVDNRKAAQAKWMKATRKVGALRKVSSLKLAQAPAVPGKEETEEQRERHRMDESWKNVSFRTLHRKSSYLEAEKDDDDGGEEDKKKD